MSSGEGFPRDIGLEIYSKFRSRIFDTVSKCNYAGSLRRGKPIIHDIEVVAEYIPTITYKFDWHDMKLHEIDKEIDVHETDKEMNELHERMGSLLKEGIINTNRPRKDGKKNPFGKRYYRINYVDNGKEYPIDLFVAMPPADFNVIYLIRTGSAEFSHWFVQQGIRRGIKVKDGHLEKDGLPIPTVSEKDVFNVMGVEYRDPEYREAVTQ